ncbi:manganese efflux pump MntP family protein [Candidatus Riflebacteria bacterium]
MDFLLVLGIAFALGCDAFSVGLAIGTKNPDLKARFRLWFHFGLFQFFMPIIGWYLGQTLVQYIQKYDHWIAFFLMFFIASNMLKESFEEEKEKDKSEPTRGWSLVMLSLATSMDALGVGFGMGITDQALIMPAICIGIVAGIMTYVGIKLGQILSIRFGKQVERCGAIILYIIAFKLLSI